MRTCQVCKKLPCVPNEFVCEPCFSNRKAELEAHYQKIKDDEDSLIKREADERWLRYINNFPHLAAYATFDLSKFDKEHRKAINEYVSRYTVENSNQGLGVMFNGDFTNKALMYGMYTLKRVMVKHFGQSHGLVSFDYTHINECISNVFGSPADSLYASSNLLLIDSINLETINENKHELRAFTAFAKYRLDLHRPTFMIVSNAYTRNPKELETYLSQAFGARLYIK